jgi:hypothetical protein
METMGEGFSWNDPDQQTDSRTGKENKLLKRLLSKGIRRQIKDNC